MQAQKKHPVIGIIGGRGILGSQFKKAFEEAGLRVLISGRKPDGVRVLSNKNLVKKADIVIVSVFLKDTEKVLREITPRLRKNQLLCDFTSVKATPLEIMKRAKSEVVGLHPMFGETESLAGKNIFFCPVRGKRWAKWLKETLKNIGLNVHEISPRKHDELAAIHQAAQQLSFLAFAQLLKKKKVNPEKLFAIGSPNTKVQLTSIGRMLAQDLEMYTDIQLQNPSAKKAVAELAEIFARLACTVVDNDRKSLLNSFRSASKFFGKWKSFAETKSSKIFENFHEKLPEVSGEIEVKKKSGPLKKVDFAVLGQNTQTQLAMLRFAFNLKLVGKKDDELTARFFKEGFSPKSTISKVFKAVLDGEAKWGFIPLENYSIGPVRETMKQLFDANGKVRIWREHTHEIHHALIGQKILNEEISHIFAHAQAHAQCEKFLRKKYPKAELVPVANAGEAIKLASKDPSTLAIGPSGILPQEFKGKLTRVADKIEDDKNNRTRFIAIATHVPKRHAPKARKTALSFFFSHNKAGQLAAALQIFAEHGINLSRIESIPTEKKKGEFFFFTECEVASSSPKFKRATRELRKIASVVELGSY